MSAGRRSKAPTTASCWRPCGPACPRRRRPRSGSPLPGRSFPRCPHPRAESAARFRCRKAGPTASAIPRPTTPRSTRPRKCRPPAVRAAVRSKIRGRCPTKPTRAMRLPSFGLCADRPARARAKCSAGEGSTIPNRSRHASGYFRKAIKAALTSSGRSCWTQWPAPSMISFCFRFGSTRSISLTRLAPIRPVITESFDPAMNSDG